MRDQLRNLFDSNISRVRNLLEIYDGLAGVGSGRRPVHSTDMLRAATVFLHTALEDFLRKLAGWKLPDGNKEALDSIPLVRISNTGNPVKFFLGSLAEHRGKTVDDLIKESVSEHLTYVTVNDTNDINHTLHSVGINTELVQHLYAELSGLMRRRHNIVHLGDANPNRGRGHHATCPIITDDVRNWANAVAELVDLTLMNVE